MKVGKDTLRKKLNRANYRYNKALNQYELISNTDIVQGVLTQKNIGVTKSEKNNIIDSGITVTNKDITLEKATLTEEEINILKVVTRSIRTYKNVLDVFASYCKENRISQKDSIALALIDFMKSKS